MYKRLHNVEIAGFKRLKNAFIGGDFWGIFSEIFFYL